jgi:tetratricopeptide (TPR) repeat protein
VPHHLIRFLTTFFLGPACAGVLLAQAPPGRPEAPGALELQLVEAARVAPDSFAAHHALGEFYLQAGRLPDAIPHLERARDLDPSHAANGYDLAVAYLETERIDAARDLARRMLALKETGALYNLLGDIDEAVGDHIAAAGDYQRAARLEPTEDHLFDWGDNLLHLRAHADAITVFTAAIRRFPDSARLHVGLGIAQYAQGEHAAAVASFCQAADLAPGDPRPYEFLGEMYGVSPDQSAEITKRLARFVELQPANAPGQYYYAMNLWKGASGAEVDLAKVEALLRKAASLDATFVKPRLQLGILLSEQARWRDAIAELKAAVALEPDLSQAHFRLATAYRRDGQPALADEELATFKRLQDRKPE